MTRFEAAVRALVNKQDAKRDSLSNVKSAYVLKQDNTRETNFSIKSRMMDMRKAVNHPYLIDYPITEDGNFYRTDEEIVSSCGKLKAGFIIKFLIPKQAQTPRPQARSKSPLVEGGKVYQVCWGRISSCKEGKGISLL